MWHPAEVAPGRARRPSVQPSVFNIPSSFFRKTTPAESQNVQDRKLDIEGRAGKRKSVN